MELHQAKEIITKLFGQDPAYPCKVKFWDESELTFGQGSPEFILYFTTPSSFSAAITDPSLGFGESYTSGDIKVEGDLEKLIALSYIHDFASKLSARDKARLCWWNFKDRYSLKQTRKDIQAHYDRGNEFYKLWLDKGMNYSCAYFKNPDDSLEQAQANKIAHSLNKLRITPGQKLLDIGCGWGSVIIHAAKHLGAKAVGITLSKEQFELARKRVKDEGLEGKVEVRLQDYRELAETGEKFDRVISIGMFEHVGKKNIPLFFEKAWDLLEDSGIMLLHTICRMKPTETDPWLTTYIFPGGYIPAIGEITSAGFDSKLLFLDAEDLRPHYYLTLGHWLSRFEQNLEKIRKMMGDQFIRMWRLYLTGCRASFRYGPMHVIQYLFAKGHDIRKWPLTREWFYSNP